MKSLNSKFQILNSRNEAFTLLELLLVIGILVILAAAGFGIYGNFVKNVQLETAEKNIIFDLKNTRSRAMTGENELKWGIHFVNSTTTDDYYELFSTPTNYASASTTVEETFFLPGNITFTSPSSGSTTDAIFNRITGTATSTSVTISFGDDFKTINVSSIGNVY